MTQTANIDPAEIKKFEDLASRWWDEHGEFKPLHEMNPLRLNFINSGSPLDGKTVCDIGCGGGSQSLLLAQQLGADARVLGLDISAPMLEVARGKLKDDDTGRAHVEFRQGDIRHFFNFSHIRNIQAEGYRPAAGPVLLRQSRPESLW